MDPNKSVTLELFVSVLISLFTGIVGLYFTKNVVYALAIVVITETITIGFLWSRISKTKNIVGIQRSFPSFADGPSLVDIGNGISSGFEFWGISAKTIVTNDSFMELINKKARGNCRFRFLVLDPEYERLAEKAHEEDDTADIWIGDIRQTTLKLKQLKEEHHLNIELRYYRRFPIFRAIFANNHVMYFGWYEIGKHGVRSPLLIVEDIPGSLFGPTKLMFENYWLESKAPF